MPVLDSMAMMPEGCQQEYFRGSMGKILPHESQKKTVEKQ